MKTFDIMQEIRALEELLYEVNEETGEVVDNNELLKEEIEKLDGEKVAKLENIELLKREIKGSNNTLEGEIKRLQIKKKANENAVKKLVDLQKILLDGKKLKSDKFSFSIRIAKSPIYNDVNIAFLDDEFIKTKQELDKTAIKNYIKAGGTIEGFRTEEKIILSVR